MLCSALSEQAALHIASSVSDAHSNRRTRLSSTLQARRAPGEGTDGGSTRGSDGGITAGDKPAKQDTIIHITTEGGNERPLQASLPEPKLAAVNTQQQEEEPPTLDDYIPLRYPDVRDHLMEDNPQVFEQQSTRDLFQTLCDNIRLRNVIRLAQDYTEWREQYEYFDPDVDPALPKPGSRLTKEALETFFKACQTTLLDVLEKGGYEPVSDEQLAAAMEKEGLEGMQVSSPDPELVDFKLFYRGSCNREVHFNSWRTWFRTKTLTVEEYQKLVVVFFLKNEGALIHLAPERVGWRKWASLGLKRLVGHKGVKVAAAEKVQSNWLYLKMFKSVDQQDVEMLLPGAVIQFSWIDYLMIWGPICFGAGSAIYNAAKGQLNFSTMQNTMTSLLTTLLPLTWGAKAYLAIKDKRHFYSARLNKLYLLHNINSNAGVLSQLLDEARDQENNEALLAYYFLWQGQARPAPMSKAELDARVEWYLNGIMQDNNLEMRVNFQVSDAVNKLKRMGIMTETPGKDGLSMLQVLPLQEAVDASALSRAAETAIRRQSQAGYGSKKLLNVGVVDCKGMAATI